MNQFDPRHVAQHGIGNPRLERLLAWILIAFLLILGLLLFAVKVNVVATADCRITASSKSRPIQSIRGGLIIRSPVESLQTVKAGDVLFEMDTTTISTEIANQSILMNELQRNNAQIQALKSVLLSIQSDPLRSALPTNPFSLKDAPDPVVISMYSALHDKVLALRRKHEAMVHEANDYKEQYEHLKAVTKSAQERVEKMRKIATLGFQSKTSLMTEEEQLHRVQGELTNLESRQQVSASNLQEVESNIRSIVSEALSTQGQNYVSNQYRLNSMSQTMESLRHTLRQETLKAPVDGTLQMVRYAGNGAIVAPGEVIGWVIPDSESIEFEAQIKNTDIGYIHSGQEVVIKIDTYPFEKYGTLPGKVVRVGTDSTFHESTGWTYRAIIQAGQDSMLIDGVLQHLRIGETGKADVILRKRRLIDYFMEPVFKYTSETFQAR